MISKEYKNYIKEKAVYPREIGNFGLAYCWLGLIEESDEAYEKLFDYNVNSKEVLKEVGDVLWYSTEICNVLDLDYEKFISKISFDAKRDKNEDIPTIEAYAGKIKKFYRDNAEINKDEMIDVLADNISELGRGIRKSIFEIMEMNFTKIKKRRETNTLHGDGDSREE